MDNFETFCAEVENATNQINLKSSISSERKGSGKFIDRITVGRVAWQEALAFVAIVQSIIIFIALIPQAVVSINSFFTMLNISFQIPVNIGSLFAVLFVIFIFVFGMLAVRWIGTLKKANEVSTKQYPGFYLLWKKIDNLEKKVAELEKQNKKNINNW